MPEYDRWGEPIPVKLTGPLGRAWSRVLYANEMFDGETGIQYGAQQRLIREWNENKPATVTVHRYDQWERGDQKYSFPTRRAAEAFADGIGLDDAMVLVRSDG